MTAVLVNGAAAGGRAQRKWREIQESVRQYLPDKWEVAMLDDSHQAREWIEEMLGRGELRFVAAGGDGTVNLLVDTIMRHAPPDVLSRICVGAVGLGSSNDLHKPTRKDREVRGVPFRLDFTSPIAHDVCLLDSDDGQSRHWIVNASIGLTADANRFFNQPDRALRFLKNVSAGAAIAYAATHTLALQRNRSMTLQVDCEPPLAADVTNIGIVKNPNFSGSLTYRSPYEPASGFFHVHLCEGMSRPRVLVTLWRSSRRGFRGLPLTRSWRAQRLVVKADEDFSVEFDGETLETRHASFSILKGAVRICS